MRQLRSKKITFRLSDTEVDRFGKMIDGLVAVHSWTDLCRKALTELAAGYKGPWSLPLDIPWEPNPKDYEPSAYAAIVPVLDDPIVKKVPSRKTSDKKRGTKAQPPRNGKAKKKPIVKKAKSR